MPTYGDRSAPSRTTENGPCQYAVLANRNAHTLPTTIATTPGGTIFSTFANRPYCSADGVVRSLVQWMIRYARNTPAYGASHTSASTRKLLRVVKKSLTNSAYAVSAPPMM